MYIISTLVLIHYEIELGLFTYFVTFYDISKKIQIFFILFTLLVGIKNNQKSMSYFPCYS